MATWVKCTKTTGELVFVNFDNALSLTQRGMRKETAIAFAGSSETFEVKGSPEDLIATSAAGRGMRRSD